MICELIPYDVRVTIHICYRKVVIIMEWKILKTFPFYSFRLILANKVLLITKLLPVITLLILMFSFF